MMLYTVQKLSRSMYMPHYYKVFSSLELFSDKQNMFACFVINFCFYGQNQVVRCCLEHAASVAKTFLTSDVVVVEIKEPEPVPATNPMDNSGIILIYIVIFES